MESTTIVSLISDVMLEEMLFDSKVTTLLPIDNTRANTFAQKKPNWKCIIDEQELRIKV